VANATDSTSRLFAAVREAQDQQLLLDDPHEHARARARLLQALEPAPVTRVDREVGLAGAWRWGLGGLAVAACALAIFVALPDRDALQIAGGDLLGCQIDLQTGSAELGPRSLVVADDQPRAILVSDSTRIELAPQGRMFVDEIRGNGAMVVLEQGEVSLAVHHEHDTSWRVAAGPWTVHVTGTQFVVAWEPSTEHFRVAVSEGSVRVEGPEDEVVKLAAGEELVRGGEIEPELLGQPHAVTLLEQDHPAIDPEQIDHHGPSLGKPSKTNVRRWSRYFDDADYHGAWEVLAASPGGIHGEAERVTNARTMLDLADVARFTKHASDTRKLLERLRERFPNSHEASEAAFALGRLAADGGSTARAAVWFERYLDERPNGSFAGDALARLIDCYDALGQTADAKSAAKRYLASHPTGPHAAKAEKILAR
jgi:ferric-dicitrate binding protein FerR (iron transport regulator)